MQKFIKYGGLIIITISLILFIKTIDKINVQNNGTIITAEVVDVPVTCDMSSKNLKAYFKFRYKEVVYTKKLKNEYCDYVRYNKTIQLKTNEDNTLFLYLNENLKKEIIVNTMTLIIGFVISFIGFKKK